MLRSSIQSQLRPAFSAVQSRTFVSTVLLTRNWENDTVATLKKEARERGLSQTGNKATLITRLQEHDSQRLPMRDPVPSKKVQSPSTPKQHLRQAHTIEAHTTEVPGVPSSSEPPVLSPNFPREFLDVKIPIPSRPSVRAPTPIPFLPDFWASGRVKAELPTPDVSSPNLIAVAGDATHISVSPAHNLYIPEAEDVHEKQDTTKTTFFQDVAADLSLPAFKLPVDTEKLQKADLTQVTGTSRGQEVDHTRKLDKDEKSGLWAFLGIFVGTWIGAVLTTPSSAFAKEEHAE
ncbi:hypothetical protein QCA50_003012 [Cerrena zonata]|uniref:SAP domain-containing protein n=1 Tax=Cerrena zonata TaxID=2478898 RepID=A0AAW0GVB8_9APHY